MQPLKKVALYALCALIVYMFKPVLPYHYFAGAMVIIVALGLLDLVQTSRRRRRK